MSSSNDLSEAKQILEHLNEVPVELIYNIATTLAEGTKTDNLTESILAFQVFTQDHPFVNTIENWSKIYSNVPNFDNFIPPTFITKTDRESNRYQFTSSMVDRLVIKEDKNTHQKYFESSNKNKVIQQIPFLSYNESQGYNRAENNARICEPLMNLLNSLTYKEIDEIKKIFHKNRYNSPNDTNYFYEFPIVTDFFNKNTFFNQICYKFTSIGVIINNDEVVQSAYDGSPMSLLNTITRSIVEYVTHYDIKPSKIDFKQTDKLSIDITIS